MRLKRLDTFGFKSFADRLTFDFEDGITSIIGPNGCGKSNVVDSIKWVIGEQSAKALRGSEMTDVIFNGCGTRRPMSHCEVTLTLDQVQIPGADTDELAITRRLTREGNSSYFLNGKACRLKDIKDMLLGTGVGNSAYSVIEQGRIGFILEASTKERRLILEEAAGISRYKAQRKIALRKLDKVQNDIERIGQVMGEVEKQLRSVRRQAEKALRHQELAENLRELRMVFAMDEHARLSEELKELHVKIEQYKTDDSEIAGRLGELEGTLTEADLRLTNLEEQIRELEQKRADDQSRRDVAKTQFTDAKHRLTEIDGQIEEEQKGIVTQKEKLVGLHNEQEETQKNIDSNTDDEDAEDSNISELYAAKQAQLDELLNKIDECIKIVDERKAQEVELLQEITRQNSDLNHLNTSLEGLGERRKRLKDRNAGHDELLTTSRGAEEDAQKTVEAAMIKAAEAHQHLDDLIRTREELQAKGQKLDSELADLRHQVAQAETRHRILQDFERKNEGINAGARGILQQMDRFPGINGLVADCFEVQAEHELAIETALGAQAQNIITDSQQVAKEAIEFLKRERRGRATFLPLDSIHSRPPLDHRLNKIPGVVGIAHELINFDKRYRPAFEYLLGGILIVETLDHGLAIKRQERLNCRIVSLEGDVINPGGAMTGGRHKGSSDGGIISRKNEIRRIGEQLQEIEERRKTISEQRDALKKEAFDASMGVEAHRKVIQQSEREVGDAKAQLMKAERDRLHAEEFASSYAGEIHEIEEEEKQIQIELEELQGKQAEGEEKRKTLNSELEKEQGVLEGFSKERDTMQEEVATLRVDLATTENRKEALRNHISHLQRQINEIDDGIQERERRIHQLENKKVELSESRERNEAIFNEAAAAFNESSEKRDTLTKERDHIRDSVEGQRDEARKLNSRRRNLDAERQQCELKANEKTVRREGLEENILEQYEIELAEAVANWERPKEINWEQLRRELHQTEREFNALGPVNLGAIEELKEVEARFNFIAKQYNDLNDAAEKLQGIIDEINKISRKKFKDTYREVRKNFQELFRKLYGGGKADLILEKTEEDILEAGIDIMAQPPGKQPKNITLLSGGEKALTAVALLFAVYKTKPSPFCILDEVDAPLDESNTDVFAKVVREFCDLSQFIVITHNKRTMQYADAIYGVTQAEQGVSTKISVKLEELEEHNELLETTQGAGPFSD